MRAIGRRQFLAAGAPLALALARPSLALAAVAGAGERFGPPQPFSFEGLRAVAKARAAKPYVGPGRPAPNLVDSIDFDAVQKIKFRPERELWPHGTGPFPVRMFPLDRYNSLPVRIFGVEGGTAREVLYTPRDFDFGNTGLGQKLPIDAGYSGFRVMNGPDAATDWLAFQGASYFRSSGQENQYGASARGIAVDTALSTKEEFPRFVAFWLEEPHRDRKSITIYALLDGLSLTGAYRFDAMRETGAVMDVTAELHFRADVARLGIAPLTSMYWYGENDRRRATDWRPEIHDSDGLAIWSGVGERIWRPLINPPRVQTNALADTNPKGFGLMQRDRNFDHYQDDGAFYNRRPSIWVEPKGDWGAGAVQLVEIPTTDEIHDNIVAYWHSAEPAKAGSSRSLGYRLYWRDDNPFPVDDIGHVVATRVGQGGVPGAPSPEDDRKRKFVVDFAGGPLARMAARFDVAPVVSLSRGVESNGYVIKVVGTQRWRALFDVSIEGKEPVDLRLFLRLGDKTLTETWLYQYFPPQ